MIYATEASGEVLERWNKKQIEKIVDGIIKDTMEYMMNLDCDQDIKTQYIDVTYQKIKEIDFRDIIDIAIYQNGISDDYVTETIQKFMMSFNKAANRAGLTA